MADPSVQQAACTLTPRDALDVSLWLIGAVGTVLAAFGAATGFFLTRYWNKRDREADQRERDLRAAEAERSKQRDVLYESLKWFEGGTQRRSIGIAVISTSWRVFEEFRPLWIEVLSNQAVYLLAASNQKKQSHEHDNLRRIVDILRAERERIEPSTRRILTDTMRQKLSGELSAGLTLTDELKGQLESWIHDFDARPHGTRGEVALPG